MEHHLTLEICKKQRLRLLCCHETCIQELTQQGHDYSMQVTYDQIIR